MDIQETGDLMVQTTERINQLAQSGSEMLSTFERIMSIRSDGSKDRTGQNDSPRKDYQYLGQIQAEPGHY